MSKTIVFKRQLYSAALLALAGAGSAHAIGIQHITPSGEAARVDKVLVRFTEDAIRLGDAQAPAPLQVSCQPAAPKGNSRWNNAREWVYTFEKTLPPGTRCNVTPVVNFRSASGKALTGAAGHSFNTGGPSVIRVRPYAYDSIEEEQVFVLRFNGPATAQSVQAKTKCDVRGLGEEVPVRLLEGQERQDLIGKLNLARLDAEQPGTLHALTCQRRLPAEADVLLTLHEGITTPNGVRSTQSQIFEYKVRAPFTAEMSCERENAQSPCLPIRPISLRFSSPITYAQAEKIRLHDNKTEHKPKFESEQLKQPDAQLERLEFAPPFADSAQLRITLPEGFTDASGRPLQNASSFPLQFASGSMPPLAKFAGGPFGVVERFAEGSDGPALVPLTVRHVEPQLQTSALQVQHLQAQSDADIIQWFTRVMAFDENSLHRQYAARHAKSPLPPVIDKENPDYVDTRTISLLQGLPGVQNMQVPAIDAKANPRPFEVVGLPLAPGFHVLEVASPTLGQSLLNQKYGHNRTLFVRSAALVTNLAVHFKLGSSNSAAWVTALDTGKPVPNAQVRVSDCRGQLVAQGQTDAQGLARFDKLPPAPPDCSDRGDEPWVGNFQSAYFVSARAESKGVQDMSFTWSSWQNGIEAWRFNVPTNLSPHTTTVAHTVTDRALLRAGETVSMKHLLRTETPTGFGLPKNPPNQLVITHRGSGQEYVQPLVWRGTATGGLSAENTFQIPTGAKLGIYQIAMRYSVRNQRGAEDHSDYHDSLHTSEFRVEEFRLPVFKGSVSPQSKEPAVAATSLPVSVQLAYINGGAASNLPVEVSAISRPRHLHFADYDDFSFAPPPEANSTPNMGDEGEEEPAARQSHRVVADKLALTLDTNGQGQITLPDLPAVKQPETLLLEATYADPSGEIQTLSHSTTLWPASVVVGLRTGSWISTGKATQMQAVVLDLAGKPKAGVPVEVKARATTTYSSRKRMVGGFYTYDSHQEVKDLGTVCSGTSDALGLVSCNARLNQPGEIQLVANARDDKGRSIQAGAAVWVMGEAELWFGGENHDRMDVLPEKKLYAPGETARFQVRMPFRKATALVSVEREGIMHTQVVELEGDTPTVELAIGKDWSPNVYVSVLALRGRLIDVPWYSFFTWGFKQPITWWKAYWHDSKDYIPPSALVDLSKPAFRLGMAEIRVDAADKQLAVSVQTDRSKYPVRGKAQVQIEVKQPNGQPAAHAEVALAAVDEALLELWPNRSWSLLEAMLQRRSWGVQTATAQMQVVGRRHYGRKAVPAGGDGGEADPSRELLDTLLLWRPSLQLDAQGRATLEVPLNDALTSFRIVAVADLGTSLFGTGSTSVRTSQDLQIISGLPPLVRSGDEYQAQFTVRNTTEQAMKVSVNPSVGFAQLQAQTLELAPGQSQAVSWTLTAPADSESLRTGRLDWHIQAKDSAGDASDALRLSQRLLPAVPITVRQAHLTQLEGSLQQDVAPPPAALPGMGGMQVSAQASLADGLPGVRHWFERYPYTCLEQKTSIALGLNDPDRWQAITSDLSSYMDSNGLVHYFPPSRGLSSGSTILTAWLLSATHEAARHNPGLALPEAERQRMLQGLTRFVQGQLNESHWAPRQDLLVRKLAALEALSRHSAVRPAMLSSISPLVDQLPSSALIDWINVLRRVPDAPQQAALLESASHALRARLTWTGSRIGFTNEQDDNWWWLMVGGDVNSARLLLLAQEDPSWKDDVARLATGLLQRQRNGAWNTTTANLWGTLAFRRLEGNSPPVTGTTRASLGNQSDQVEWAQAAGQTSAAKRPMNLPWPGGNGSGTLHVTHEGSGRPWLSMLSLAAVPLKEATNAGYQISRSVTALESMQKDQPAGQYSRGDVLRVTLTIKASATMTWVAINDPVPTGATILGSGLGRDAAIAAQGETSEGLWPTYEERAHDAYRAYYRVLPQGETKVEYTMRLNNSGTFALPPTRVEALYAPEFYGESPNAPVKVR